MYVMLSEPPSIVPFSFGSAIVNEGDMAQLTCFVQRGDEPLRISWSLKGDTISSGPSMTTTMIGTRTSMLMISSVGYRHVGSYTCTASNKAGTVSHAAELNVNGKFTQGEVDRKALECADLSWRLFEIVVSYFPRATSDWTFCICV